MADASELVVSIRSGLPYDVRVARPGPWGNPFSHLEDSVGTTKVATVEEAVARHRDWLVSQPELVAKVKEELRGKRLGCYCMLPPCHAYTLAEVANSP